MHKLNQEWMFFGAHVTNVDLVHLDVDKKDAWQNVNMWQAGMRMCWGHSQAVAVFEANSV